MVVIVLAVVLTFISLAAVLVMWPAASSKSTLFAVIEAVGSSLAGVGAGIGAGESWWAECTMRMRCLARWSSSG